MSRPPDRFRRRRRSRSASSWRCRSTESQSGLIGYLKTYLEPTWLMLPFHLLGEVTRTLALAVRLFGNIMSGTMILAILLSVAPLFFGPHDGSRPADRARSGLHFQHSRDGLYRRSHPLGRRADNQGMSTLWIPHN